MSRALCLSAAAAEAFDDAVAERLENDRFWATLNGRMMLHGERLEASAERTTALIDEMAAAWAADADFNDVWGTMSYREAVALPCCPYCGSVPFEMANEEPWWASAESYEQAGHPGYVDMMKWGRGRCFPTITALARAYREDLSNG